MEGMKHVISLDENNKLIIKGAAVISDKGVIPSFDGEFVMYGSDVQRLMVLLNEGNYLRREEIPLSCDDGSLGFYGCGCGWSTFAVLNDEQVAEMLKKQDATIKELRKREKLLSDDVKARMENEKMLATENELLKKKIEALKKENKEYKSKWNELEGELGCTDEALFNIGEYIERFFGRFKKKK